MKTELRRRLLMGVLLSGMVVGFDTRAHAEGGVGTGQGAGSSASGVHPSGMGSHGVSSSGVSGSDHSNGASAAGAGNGASGPNGRGSLNERSEPTQKDNSAGSGMTGSNSSIGVGGERRQQRENAQDSIVPEDQIPPTGGRATDNMDRQHFGR